MDLKSWVGEVFGFNNDIKSLIAEKQSIISAKDSVIDSLNGQVNQLTASLQSTSNQKDAIIADLQKQLAPDPKTTYWDNRLPKTDITYTRWEQNNAYEIDIRNFLNVHDATLPIVQGKDDDEKAINALRWVRQNINYSSDSSVFGKDEYWAFAFETMSKRRGDCEDGAILLANIMIRSGVNPKRVRLVAGTVNGGGHCYCVYRRMSDDQWVVVDWCYWPNDLPMSQRKLHKDEQNYDDPTHNWGIWFSCDYEFCWGVAQTMIGMPNDFVTK